MHDIIMMILILGIPVWCWAGVLFIEWAMGQRGKHYDQGL